MNYQLNKEAEGKEASLLKAIKTLAPFLVKEKWVIAIAMFAVIANAALSLTGPKLIADAIDKHLVLGDYTGVLHYVAIIVGVYVGALIFSYLQTRLMGEVGQRVLFRLRNAIFEKLQSLPVAFFNQNKAGDLISRINNDTEKINGFFSQSLVQFFGNIFLMIGAGILLLSLNFQLGAAALAPAVVLLVITRVLSPWIKRKNLESSRAFGTLNSQVQESMQNFKVIIAFNRRDFFKDSFKKVNRQNYKAWLWAGIANTAFTPIYGLATNIGQLIVLALGLSLIASGNFTIGLLISFLSYTSQFYNPLRHMAALWANFQAAMASWERVYEILKHTSNLDTELNGKKSKKPLLLEFRNVAFAYPGGEPVLSKVNMELEQGKTYALVGPTGGGKSTTASLMARLFDPVDGMVYLNGLDIRSYTEHERADKIGFILQDAMLFSGTVAENLRYGNTRFAEASDDEMEREVKERGLEGILERFENGLKTEIKPGSGELSLGQRQLIAFMRAILRDPELLILDEATANIDTVTEQLLEEILEKLPAETTKVVIAHRLNTIENADEIYFVNNKTVKAAGSMEHAVELLLSQSKNS